MELYQAKDPPITAAMKPKTYSSVKARGNWYGSLTGALAAIASAFRRRKSFTVGMNENELKTD